MTRAPWMKFYPADWRSDTALRSCSPAARAVWIDLLGLMHEAEPYGHLLINGASPSVKALSGLLNVHHKTLIAALKELSENGVYSVDSEGVIYSRRMVRDREKALQDKENGKRGGNPGLTPRLTSPEPVGDKAQRPEARSQSQKVVVAVEDGRDFRTLIREAQARAGEACNLTSGNVHHVADLRRLLDGGCDWELDVLPAIDRVAASFMARGKQFSSWAILADAAVDNRNKRLNGLPNPKPNGASNGRHDARAAERAAWDAICGPVAGDAAGGPGPPVALGKA